MPLVLRNKQIKKRKKDVCEFMSFMNKNYDIPHKVHVHVIDFPCVYVDTDPAWGIFYVDKFPVIEVANDFEWYKDNLKEDLNVKYILISTLAHEIIHYFQHRDGKKAVEANVNKKAEKIVTDFYSYRKMNYPVFTESHSMFMAKDPIKHFWKNAGFK